MVILDTDHFSLIQYPESPIATRILDRFASMGLQLIITTIVTYEEQTRGWLAQIARAKTLPREIEAYRQLNRNPGDFRKSRVLDFEDEAAAELQRLRRLKIRIGTMDLKIAAMTIVRDATLLSRDLTDFKKVPGLKVEDWTL